MNRHDWETRNDNNAANVQSGNQGNSRAIAAEGNRNIGGGAVARPSGQGSPRAAAADGRTHGNPPHAAPARPLVSYAMSTG